ncbi:MAG: phosphatidylglycerophosphatase A [Deltaproteobacteria bacterium]|nr:phosphatidylglycerophosphatase A [Deltaproteobacteria bacterium]
MRFIIKFIASAAFLGYFPYIPGTAGTLMGIPIAIAFARMPSFLHFITLIGFFFASAWFSSLAEKIFKKKDAKEIVIDEVMGYLITMAYLPIYWPYIIGGFFLFRFFDIVKPYPAKFFDQKVKGGIGVVADDVVAGLYANLIMQIIKLIF